MVDSYTTELDVHLLWRILGAIQRLARFELRAFIVLGITRWAKCSNIFVYSDVFRSAS